MEEDFETTEDFAGTLETPAKTSAAVKPERSEAHREAQRLAALKQWQARDRWDGVPPPLQVKPDPKSRRTSTQVLLDKRLAADSSITGMVNEYVRRTADELGGMPNLRAGQRAMLVAQKVTLTIILCLEDQLTASGSLMGEDGKPHAFLGIEDAFGTARCMVHMWDQSIAVNYA